MKTFSKILLATAATLSIAAPSNAATQSTTFQVTANVAGTCSITANPIAFGTYAGTQVDQSSTLAVNCTTGTGYSVTLNNGANATGAQRRMINGASFIPYQIYTDNTYATIWNGAVTGPTAGASGNGTNQSYSMYGRAPAGTPGASGNYLDTVTATVTY